MLNTQMLDKLKELISKAKSKFTLENNSETWQKIGDRSIIDELYQNGIDDPDNYLKTWIEENDYLS